MTDDSRSLAERALADAEAALADFRVNNGMKKKYAIGSRSIEFADSAGIIAEIQYWRQRVELEKVNASIAGGRGNPRRRYARFV